jgi:hypothetical protein
MELAHHIPLGPFGLDVTHGRLWRGEPVIGLRPRSLAVLRYLVAHPGRLSPIGSVTRMNGQLIL